MLATGNMAAVIERVDCVEQALQDFVTSTDVDRFVDEISAFRTFFPEYDALPLVGVLASRSVEASVLACAEQQGFLVLAIGDQLIDVQDSPDFQPKRWSAA